MQIIDALQNLEDARAVAIFDSDPNARNASILGVPVLDTSDKVAAHFQQGVFDALVIALGGNLLERERVFREYDSQNIPFANVIDPSAQIRSEAKIGRGNILLGGVYLGPGTIVGDNCYIISNTTIQHHSLVGDHCYFSTSVAIAGRVKVGNRVRFDTASGAKANAALGDDSTVSAGCIVTQNVPAGATVEAPEFTISRSVAN